MCKSSHWHKKWKQWYKPIFIKPSTFAELSCKSEGGTDKLLAELPVLHCYNPEAYSLPLSVAGVPAVVFFMEDFWTVFKAVTINQRRVNNGRHYAGRG